MPTNSVYRAYRRYLAAALLPIPVAAPGWSAPVRAIAASFESRASSAPSAEPAKGFDWDTAKCPAWNTEPHAVVTLPRAASATAVPKVVVALERLDEGPLEARFAYADKTFEVAASAPIATRDDQTVGLTFSPERHEGVTSVRVRSGDHLVACRRFYQAPQAESWTSHDDALFSLWIARLFSFSIDDIHMGLTPLLRSAERNLLLDSLGQGEDDEKSPIDITPDCADMPLALRAYFAWKLGLPFGAERKLSEAEHAAALPSAHGRTFAIYFDPMRSSTAGTVQFALQTLGREVSSNDLRDEASSPTSSLYPISLTRDALRPGAAYVDPYSHVSIVAGWESTGTERRRLVLADAQPSGMVALHRYVEGRLVYAPKGGGAGFKWYRPILRNDDKQWTPATKEQLAERRDEALRSNYSEYGRGDASFFERIATLQDPRPLDPVAAYLEIFDALGSELAAREKMVELGFASRLKSGVDVPLPRTPRLLFHATGEWESYASPCRDLKLLGFLRNLARFPDAVAANPSRYRLAPGETPAQVRARLGALGETWAAERSLAYIRSDQSVFSLPLAAVLSRKTAFEAAYSPNDCPELRWGAAADSDEAKACAVKSSAADRKTMESYRSWFKEGYGCE